MIDIRYGGPVFEMHGALAVVAADSRNGRHPLDVGVFEGFIAEVRVVSTPHNGVDGCLSRID